jgi:Swt1-like HEPN
MALDDSINALENSLRDLIERVLRKRYGEPWAEHMGITPERRAHWVGRREEERKKRTAGVIDERLLYYADFTDLFAIIKKNWDPDFRACFGDQTELRVYLEKLADLRNPDAHSRSLLEVEERLVEGMTGELRQKITIFLSKGGGGPEPERFARIEEVVDSFAEVASPVPPQARGPSPQTSPCGRGIGLFFEARHGTPRGRRWLGGCSSESPTRAYTFPGMRSNTSGRSPRRTLPRTAMSPLPSFLSVRSTDSSNTALTTTRTSSTRCCPPDN